MGNAHDTHAVAISIDNIIIYAIKKDIIGEITTVVAVHLVTAQL